VDHRDSVVIGSGVLRDWTLALDLDRALAAQGLDPAAAGARTRRVLETTREALAEAQSLISPEVVYRELAVEMASHDGVQLAGGPRLAGSALADAFGSAARLVVAVCTIGPALEERASSRIATDPLIGLALDGLGSAAVEELARGVCQLFTARATAVGMRATQPLSPGMSGWDLGEGQRQLFALVDARQVGVSLNRSSLMTPRKSLSMAVGLGRDVTAEGRVCARCGMSSTCRFQYHHA
jgi:hypothetical protein